MSLFKARDWWSTSVGSGSEEFDLGCLCPVYTSAQAALPELLAIGSHAGVLRLLRPDSSNYKAEQLLLEQDLNQPILQISCGLFLPALNKPGIAILHPRKLSIYSISTNAGAVEHGSQYKLQPAYHHNLSRTSFNMCYGNFGHVQGKDFICVQSMDGTLSVFEQESFSFTRFLPDSLLPGPLCYISSTDSFITVSTARQIESYKYQVLAVAADTKTKEEAQNVKSGKRVSADWTFTIGEDAIDIGADETNSACILVLGERSIFCVNEFGQLKFMKKLDYEPRCMKLLPRVGEELMYMVATHTNTLMIYKNMSLNWAAQISKTPVVITSYPIGKTPGGVMMCDETGYLSLSYLGTDPAMMMMPSTQSRETKYDDYADQLKKYHQIIKQHANQAITPTIKSENDLEIMCSTSGSLDNPSLAENVLFNDDDIIPSITVKIEIKARMLTSNVKLMVHVDMPFYSPQIQYDFSTIETIPSGGDSAGSPAAVSLPIFMKYNLLPTDLCVSLSVSYTNSAGAPRVQQSKFNLPLNLAVKPALPVKSAMFKITIDTDKPPVPLNKLFSEFATDTYSESQGNALGLQYYGGTVVTMLASKTSQRYRLQADDFASLWLVCRELTQRLNQHFGPKNQIHFSHSGSLPLQEYFETIDAHFDYRMNYKKYCEVLEQKSAQFRAIQTRLLTRFKDKTPSPLLHLDTLLEGTYRQIVALADHAEDNRKILYRSSLNLSSSTNLLTYLAKITYSLDDEDFNILQSVITPNVTDNADQGWEELVDTALTHTLRTTMSKTSKDQNVNIDMVNMGEDTGKLKKHIIIFLERLNKGAKLTTNTSTDSEFTVSPEQSKAVDKVIDRRNIAETGRENSLLGTSGLPTSSQFLSSPRGGNSHKLPQINGGAELPPLKQAKAALMAEEPLKPIKKKTALKPLKSRLHEVPDLDDMTSEPV